MCSFSDNATQCFGRNNMGQLGIGSTTNATSPASVINTGTGDDTTQLSAAAGGYHSCILTDTGSVKCFGDNSGGQLGQQSTNRKGHFTATMGNTLQGIELKNVTPDGFEFVEAGTDRFGGNATDLDIQIRYDATAPWDQYRVVESTHHVAVLGIQHFQHLVQLLLMLFQHQQVKVLNTLHSSMVFKLIQQTYQIVL